MKSYWEEDRKKYKKWESINDDIKTDICIIGGGLAGLSTAYYSCLQTDVVILEKDRICSKTSGKNTGKVTSQHGLFYDYLLNSQGEEYAKDYLNINENAINEIERIINKENIDCDFTKESSYVFTKQEKEIEKIKNENKVVNHLQKEISAYTKDVELPIEIKGAIEFKNQAQIHPIKYGYGLAKAIEKNGGKIFENTQVKNVRKEENRYIIDVNDKKVIANHVVIATRYPIISFPGYYFLKMYQSTSYAMVFDCKEQLFKGMYISAEVPTISFRVIKERNKELLLVVGYDYKTGTAEAEDGYQNITTIVKNIYPKAKCLYKWTAEDCISLDKIPYVGEYSSTMKNLYIATGFNKWGITLSNVAGKIISDKIFNKENRFENIFKSTRLRPVKNKDEFLNMAKEAGKSIILSKFKIPEEKLEKIKNDEGKIININDKKVGVYKDKEGKVYAVKPICTHLGCELYFNNIEKIWECPCHGSKFNYDGTSIEVPSNKNLEKFE